MLRVAHRRQLQVEFEHETLGSRHATLLEFNETGTTIEARVKAIYDGFVQVLERIVRVGKAAGEFRADLDAREMAAVVMALQHGTLMGWYCRSGTLNGPGLVRSARVVLLDGILLDAGIRRASGE